MKTALYLSLGSNLGDRKGNINMALEKLDNAFGCHYSSLSDIIETEAFGFDGEAFLNAAVLYEIETDKYTPIELLDVCKEVERSLGRTDAPEYDEQGERVYHSRTIDIDILFIGEETIESERLVVPHKDIENRDFVMIPLRQIAKPGLKAAFPGYFDYLCGA